jgi:hypothetical protein
MNTKDALIFGRALAGAHQSEFTVQIIPLDFPAAAGNGREARRTKAVRMTILW